ncbi:Sh [Symbiodinium pilosum]|uniref:Sh protein n=1 Tax=Symbiodinium pilosum TaxID=2952 RepID=A0A812WZ03_SYMPI|nr:Sh [Symbiodinium pilosum]
MGDEHDSVFFQHVALLTQEYSRLRSENQNLQHALAQLSQHAKDVETSAVSPVLLAEAFHGTEDNQVTEVTESTQAEQIITETETTVGDRVRFQQAANTLSNSMDSRAASKIDWDIMPETNMGRHAIFSQGQRLKAAIAEDMVNDMRYDVKNMYKTSGCFQYIARHPWFENFTMVVIVTYALYMSFDTDLNQAAIITATAPFFIISEQLFCFYFTLELFIRFMAFERKCNSFKDAWFVFDFALVFMMVAETWVMNIVILAMAGANPGANFLGDVSIMRIARLLRLTRLLRMARLIRFFPELLIMVKAVWSAARSVGFTLVLLGICLYVFAIAFRTTLPRESSNVGELYFRNVPAAMHTLFVQGTLLDSISELFNDMINEEEWAGLIILYVFIIISAVTVMNMLIGVLCEVITAVADAEKEALQVSWTTEVLQTCLQLGADENNDGCIDFNEFQHMVSNQKVRKVLREADVDVQTLVNFVDVLFENSGDDGGYYEKVPFSEFMERLLKLRGSNTATVKDLVDLRKWMMRELLDLKTQVVRTASRIETSRVETPKSKPRSSSAPYGLPFEFVMQV